jgi:hypothetical protein
MKIAVIGPPQLTHIVAERFSKEGAQVAIFSASSLKRVHKRFLGPREIGHGRLVDLFRVVTKVDPAQSELLETMPMAQELKTELRRPHEGFEDFDLVIEIDDPYQVGGLGPGGSLVLHEDLNPQGLVYGLSSLQTSEVQSSPRLALVGEGFLTAQALLDLRPWLLTPGHSLTIVTPEKAWLSELRQSGQDQLISEVDKFLSELMQKWKHKADEFSKELHAWRAQLETGNKVAAPVEPTAPLIIYEGFNATSIDRLSDREELYLTIESPAWRGQAQDVLKILALDCVCGLVSSPQRLAVGMAEKEPGYYQLTFQDQHDLATSLEQVWHDILTYFSRS